MLATRAHPVPSRTYRHIGAVQWRGVVVTARTPAAEGDAGCCKPQERPSGPLMRSFGHPTTSSTRVGPRYGGSRCLG
jgi:hypothetical protein